MKYLTNCLTYYETTELDCVQKPIAFVYPLLLCHRGMR